MVTNSHHDEDYDGGCHTCGSGGCDGTGGDNDSRNNDDENDVVKRSKKLLVGKAAKLKTTAG